ncbi:MAG: efflux RND transporter periplasmic adaptor subunit [Gammaproteobacteria bacterium]|jgi:RND family efflux transporter MFP subunit|nr:efflux RND transporter periplasmic adaptor subunit [Gammaproteobacteria bacterium]MBU1408941.1 efflux RND transporter periplasmic adaptor subunit [Gammaproteobacteria bacterium]MBU1533638.1 efflux RND transporter periplasmic adaptor subunit [Gammaproteobacteria bacterium]
MKQRMAAIALAGLCLGGAGPLWAADKVELTTRVSGVVEEVLVKPGQRVKKGAVLLRLDKTVLQARLDEVAAERARADADEEDAKRELERAQELFDRTVSSTSELEAATLRHARAQAALSGANARLVIAKKNLGDAELRAPFSGVVSAVPGGPGTVVTADCQPKTLIVLGSGQP